MSSAWNPSVIREAPYKIREVLEGTVLQQAGSRPLDLFLTDIIALAEWALSAADEARKQTIWYHWLAAAAILIT